MYNFDLEDVLDEAISLAGGQTASAEEIIGARRSVHLTLASWSAMGLNTWRIGSVVLGLSGAAGALVLPPNTDDVLDVRVSLSNAGNANPTEGSWTAITRVSRDEFNAIADRGLRGRPSRYWLERSVPAPKLHMHPVGEAGGAAHVVYVGLPMGGTALSDDIETIPTRWMPALVYAVALSIARKRVARGADVPPAVVADLSTTAQQMFDAARINDQPRTPIRVGMGR